MRKVTRKGLNELAILMPVISEENQKSFIGGTSGCTGTADNMSEIGLIGCSGHESVEYTGYIGGGDGSDSGPSGSSGTADYPYYGGGSGVIPDSPNNGNYSNGGVDSGVYTQQNPCSSDEYGMQVASGTWEGGYVEGIGYCPKYVGGNEVDGKPKKWVESLLNLLYCGNGEGTVNLPDIIPVGNTPSTAYCTTSASYQTVTINGVTLTNIYVEATSSAAHPEVSTGYSWKKPVYDNNDNLVKMSYYFDVSGSDLDVVITVSANQMQQFETLFRKSR